MFSSDLFYRPDEELYRRLAAHGVLAVEMEAAGLYGVAAATGTAALAVCTVSDHLPRGEHLGRRGAGDRASTQMICAGARRAGLIGRERPPAPSSAAQPTEPSICSSIRRLHSTAYSMGSVRVTGSMKPLTTMPMACSSERPRLCR